MTWELSLAGALIGVLVGMTGMGGGSLMTPVLILVFGFDAKVAVGTDILHGAVFKSFGAWRHRVLGSVHARLACWLLVGSAPFSLLGVQLAESFGEDADAFLQRLVGAALILGGLGFLIKTFVHGRAGSEAPFLLHPRDRVFAVAVGASCGFVVGLTSVGSGTFFGLAMLLLYPLTARKIVGTDVAHAAALLWVAGASHVLHGNVDMHAMGWLLLGSIPGVLLGTQMSIKIPERALRAAFGAILMLSGLKLAGAPGWVLVLAAVASALAFALWFIARRLARRTVAELS
jgi:uncharacterized protein